MMEKAPPPPGSREAAESELEEGRNRLASLTPDKDARDHTTRVSESGGVEVARKPVLERMKGDVRAGLDKVLMLLGTGDAVDAASEVERLKRQLEASE